MNRYIILHKIQSRVENWWDNSQIHKISRRLIIPGFEGLPLYDVASFFVRGVQKGSLATRASAISFSFFLAIFPTIIFFFTLIPYIPIDNFQDVLMQTLKNVLPAKSYDASITTLEDIIKRPRGGLLSIGFILALYFSTNGINSLIDAFNSSYHSVDSRKRFMQRMISIVLVLILSSLILFSTVLLIGTNFFIDYIAAHGHVSGQITIALLKFSKWIILVALCLISISFIYYLAPAKKMRFRFISAGSSFATLLSILASVGFNFYANNFAKYNVLYGSIGTLLLVLVWIYFNSFILLLGFELNVSIHSAKKSVQYSMQSDEEE